MAPLARPPSPAGARHGGARPASRPAPAGRLILAQAGARPDGAVAPAPVAAPLSGVHAAAAARRAAAEARRSAYQAEVRLALDDKWFEAPGPSNWRSIAGPAAFADLLSTTSPSTLIVAEYFVPWCPGCRTLQPKLHAIAAANPDAAFVTINGGNGDPATAAWVEGRGVTRLPWFELIRGGRVVTALAANLSAVARLRAEIAAAKCCEGECAEKR